MKRFYLPPLLRGIGTTILLLGTFIAFLNAPQSIQNFSVARQMMRLPPLPPAPTMTNSAPPNTVGTTAGGAKEEVADEIWGNRYFEWMGLAGTAIIAGSFFVESLIKRS